MTNKVHDTKLMLLVFLDLKKVGDFSLITFCHIKQLTLIRHCINALAGRNVKDLSLKCLPHIFSTKRGGSSAAI